MNTLQINRTYAATGTNGEIVWDGKVIGHSIELPWKDNANRVSCIPEGTYPLVKRYSPKHGWHLLVTNVPGRDLILLHPANNAQKELQGCIAPVTTLTGPGLGSSSRAMVDKIEAILFPLLAASNQVMLTIKKK